jgi:predicted RNA binding protein YcfA (HicA-like mRNA interferase family)
MNEGTFSSLCALALCPHTIRDLIKHLGHAGWVLDHFTGGHRIYKPAHVAAHVWLSGKKADRAHPYQQLLVQAALKQKHAQR